MLKVALRLTLVSAALAYLIPNVIGVKVHGGPLELMQAAVVFNVVFWSLECLLAVMVVGINIGTLGLGSILAAVLKFAANLISPSLALVGTAQILPDYLQISSFFPGAIGAGLLLGGLLWASTPVVKRSSKREE